MKAMNNWYTGLSEYLDERRSLAKDWKWLAAIALLGYAVAFAFRAMEAGNWSVAQLQAGGETILATHDSYGWLAAAKGVNTGFEHYGFAGLARWLVALTGAPLWKVAFWAPAFFGALPAVVSALWGWLLGGRRTAIAAGLLGALAPGFFYRSRLGYFATDLATLLLPLLLSFFLAYLLSFFCSRAWAPTPAELDDETDAPAGLPWAALCFGLVAKTAHAWHDDILRMGMLLFGVALAVLFLAGRKGRRLDGLQVLLVYGLAAYGGYLRLFGVDIFNDWFHPGSLSGPFLAALLAALLWKRPAAAMPVLRHPWPYLGALGVLFLLMFDHGQFGRFLVKFLSYLKPVADKGTGAVVDAPVYPAIVQSIREAKNVEFGAFFHGVSAGYWAGVPALFGLIAMLLLRPVSLVLLPILGIAAASLAMGVRFAMFGGPLFALGLGLGVHWGLKALLRGTGARDWMLTAAQGVVAAACLLVYWQLYSQATPTPVLASAHAQALMKLRETAPKDAQVWTWWDYGYATQYYAERMTPTDGGRHAGRDIFPTALAYTTPSFRQAAQVMALSAAFEHDPAKRWDALPAKDVQASLEALAATERGFPKSPPQYIVACWENVSLLSWISFFGSWSLESGSGTRAKVQQVLEAFNVEPTRGLMVYRNGSPPIAIKSVDFLSRQGPKRAQFPMNAGGPHLVINDEAKQVFLMDDLAYNSMAVQLLIGDPARPELTRYFKLAYEGFPLVRIYEAQVAVEQAAPKAEAFTQ